MFNFISFMQLGNHYQILSILTNFFSDKLLYKKNSSSTFLRDSTLFFYSREFCFTSFFIFYIRGHIHHSRQCRRNRRELLRRGNVIRTCVPDIFFRLSIKSFYDSVLNYKCDIYNKSIRPRSWEKKTQPRSFHVVPYGPIHV